MRRYRPTIEEIAATRQLREEMSAKVAGSKEIYFNLKEICNKENSTEEDFKALETARVEWLNAGLENEREISQLYR